ncbi:YpzG family protein [Sutcliffiella deserti]|uniref:YpzG family protein n=1 Tax=Sutcliffiella deserti TaxID=2875501 RepID=UPI001CC12057|nr:YpzG family protein [Sutcliffiella deserti]
MSYRDQLDQQSQKFHHNTTRRKHASSQVNGQSQMSQSVIIARSDAKAHRMF